MVTDAPIGTVGAEQILSKWTIQSIWVRKHQTVDPCALHFKWLLMLHLYFFIQPNGLSRKEDFFNSKGHY